MKKQKKRVLGNDPFLQKPAKPVPAAPASLSAATNTPELQQAPATKRRRRDALPTPAMNAIARTPVTPPLPQSLQASEGRSRITAPGRGRPDAEARTTPPLAGPKTAPYLPAPTLRVSARPTAPAGRRRAQTPEVVAPAVEIAEVPRLIAGVTAFEEADSQPARTLTSPRPSSLFAAARGLVKAAAALVRGPKNVDAFGRDNAFADALRPVGDVLVDRYWNVAIEGLEHLPAGACLVVANCGATLPLEGPVFQLGLRRAGISSRWLLDPTLFHTPITGPTLNRVGAVEATGPNAAALFKQRQVVVGFPEGAAAVGKRFTRRYQLQPFASTLFEAAVSAKVPVVCAAICGAEEASPGLGNLPAIWGLPSLPLTVPPLPGRWLIRVGPTLDTTTDAKTLATRAQDGVAQLLGELLRHRAQSNGS